MAATMTRESLLPTIKCSECGVGVEISMMGDHICGSKAKAPEPKASRFQMFKSLKPSISHTSKLSALPKIDPKAGNKPFVPLQPYHPPKANTNANLFSRDSALDGQPLRSPSLHPTVTYDRKQQDSAFPAFQSPATSPKETRSPNSLSPRDENFTGPASPTRLGGKQVAARMNGIAPGPFGVGGGSKREHQPEAPPPIVTKFPERKSSKAGIEPLPAVAAYFSPVDKKSRQSRWRETQGSIKLGFEEFSLPPLTGKSDRNPESPVYAFSPRKSSDASSERFQWDSPLSPGSSRPKGLPEPIPEVPETKAPVVQRKPVQNFGGEWKPPALFTGSPEPAKKQIKSPPLVRSETTALPAKPKPKPQPQEAPIQRSQTQADRSMPTSTAPATKQRVPPHPGIGIPLRPSQTVKKKQNPIVNAPQTVPASASAAIAPNAPFKQSHTSTPSQSSLSKALPRPPPATPEALTPPHLPASSSSSSTISAPPPPAAPQRRFSPAPAPTASLGLGEPRPLMPAADPSRTRTPSPARPRSPPTSKRPPIRTATPPKNSDREDSHARHAATHSLSSNGSIASAASHFSKLSSSSMSSPPTSEISMASRTSGPRFVPPARHDPMDAPAPGVEGLGLVDGLMKALTSSMDRANIALPDFSNPQDFVKDSKPSSRPPSRGQNRSRNQFRGGIPEMPEDGSGFPVPPPMHSPGFPSRPSSANRMHQRMPSRGRSDAPQGMGMGMGMGMGQRAPSNGPRRSPPSATGWDPSPISEQAPPIPNNSRPGPSNPPSRAPSQQFSTYPDSVPSRVSVSTTNTSFDTATPPSTAPPSRAPTHKRTATSKGPCRGCNEPIFGKSISSADGRLTGRYHKQCFICQDCRQPFRSAEFYVMDNLPYCEFDYHSRNHSLCRACNRGIEGPCLETERDERFHPVCFCCFTCRAPLGDDYYEVNAKPYCERHAIAMTRPPPPQQQYPRGPPQGLPPPPRFAQQNTFVPPSPRMGKKGMGMDMDVGSDFDMDWGFDDDNDAPGFGGTVKSNRSFGSVKSGAGGGAGAKKGKGKGGWEPPKLKAPPAASMGTSMEVNGKLEKRKTRMMMLQLGAVY